MRIFRFDKLSIKNRTPILLVVMIVFSMTSACFYTFGGDLGQNETVDAIQVQQTQLSQTGTALAGFVAQNTPDAPLTTSTNSYPATPSNVPMEILVDTPTVEITPAIQPPVEVEERMLKSAKILVFEDMSASRHIRYVKEALDQEDYFYLDVGSAKGWFKSQLLSSEEWDLIIAAAESRSEFGGEFFQYIDDHVARGASAIVEFWDWDAAPMGKSKLLLDRCGVSFQADWFEPKLRVFYWLSPENPLFQFPNQISNQLGNSERLWIGDIGDLFEIKYKNGTPSGDAVILAGTNPAWSNDHGVLVSCLEGQVILQGFSSHEYRRQDIVPLWKNYIYHTLKSHFENSGKVIPTPVATVITSSIETPTPDQDLPGLTPGPEYLLDHDCDGLMTASLMDAPIFQKDLFEHHAKGTFLIVKLQLKNLTDFPIQIWDQDYAVTGDVNGKVMRYAPDKAATGYLYIESPSNLSQDIIQPGENWRTRIAFDIDPAGKDWIFVVTPGKEFNQQVCQASITLAK